MSQSEIKKKRTTISQLKSKLVYLERQYARLKLVERKQDARTKFKLGLLVQKAQLADESDEVIFGIAKEAYRALQEKNQTQTTAWRFKGDLAFSMETTKDNFSKSPFTQHTIKQGALLIKAGLDNFQTAIIFGVLLEAKENLEGKDAEKYRMHWFKISIESKSF